MKQNSGANAVGHKGIVSAVTTAIVDRFSQKGVLPPLDPNVRLDGKVVLITGANSGLGKAVAVDIAKKGAQVIMACRSGHPDAGADVRRLSGNNKVSMIKVDLADMDSVSQLCDQLRDQGIKLDIAIMNAGLMPLNARKSPQGYELMFAVHFLANRLMLARWLQDGVVPLAEKDSSQHAPARVIFVASEAHQSSDPIDFEHFGAFVDYGMKDGMKHYGMTKLHLCTFAHELSRQVNGLAVHALCPGPIASNIARESPAWVRPILGPIMKLLFRSPQQAAEPVVLLACDPGMGKRTDAYLHMMREKTTSPLASDPENGRLLWEKSQVIIEPWLTQSATPGNTQTTSIAQAGENAS